MPLYQFIVCAVLAVLPTAPQSAVLPMVQQPAVLPVQIADIEQQNDEVCSYENDKF